MAIGPIGNTIFVNQQVPYVSSTVGETNARFELQNVMAQHIANEEEQKVQEVREPEENHEVDPDREHQRQEQDEEAKNRKEAAEHKKEEEDTPLSSSPLHKLDIKV